MQLINFTQTSNICYHFTQFFSILLLEKTNKFIFYFNISIIIVKNNRPMNKVSPILDDEYNSSVDTIHRKNQLKPKHTTTYQQYTGVKTCKICLDDQSTPDITSQGSDMNEKDMIVPCECRGSVGFVHQKCIKMWIQKQLEGNKSKRAYCEICKSQIFFKKIKIRYCDCKIGNICETSPCNLVCVVAQLVLIGIVGLVEYYVDHLMNFQLLRNSLLALLAILCATFLLTIFLIIKQVFIKSYKDVQKIYSLTESEQLGFREPMCKSAIKIDRATKKRKIAVAKKERNSSSSQRPFNPFQSISPEFVITFG